MNLLVTGGTGFLGQHLIRRLRELGHQVRVLGRNPKVCQTLATAGFEVLPGDLCDRPLLERACAGIDAVFHVAALSAPWGRRDDFFRANVDGTSNVLHACRAQKVRRFLHVSSPSVTFDGRDHLLGTEDVPYPPRYLCVYSETKKIAEEMVRSAHGPALATTILRPKAIFGPGDTTLLPRLIDAARIGRLPQIGDGSNLVDLTYVDNVVHALVLALEASTSFGKTYTITNAEHVPLWDLIRHVLQRVGVTKPLRSVPFRVAYALAWGMEWRARLLGGEPRLTRYTTAILGRTQTYDLRAARQDLNYEPLVSIADGVERTLAWFTSQDRQ